MGKNIRNSSAARKRATKVIASADFSLDHRKVFGKRGPTRSNKIGRRRHARQEKNLNPRDFEFVFPHAEPPRPRHHRVDKSRALRSQTIGVLILRASASALRLQVFRTPAAARLLDRCAEQHAKSLRGFRSATDLPFHIPTQMTFQFLERHGVFNSGSEHLAAPLDNGLFQIEHSSNHFKGEPINLPLGGREQPSP